MYLSFKDFLLALLKSFILTILLLSFSGLCMLDYQLGIGYCNAMNIPRDFAISIMSPGMAIEISIVLFVIEIIALYLIVKNLKRFKAFNKFCDFMSLEF